MKIKNAILITISLLLLLTNNDIFCSDYFSEKITSSEAEILFDMERIYGGSSPNVSRDVDNYNYYARNPFTADSGTGNYFNPILNVSLLSDTMSIDTLILSSDQPFLTFRTMDRPGKQHTIPDYVQQAEFYNVSYGRYLDLELLFLPTKTMTPGYKTCYMTFKAKELNDSGFIKLKLPNILFYNPYEWIDSTKKPGIEIFFISNKKDTSNMIIGSGYMAKSWCDTIYGEGIWPVKMDEFEARIIPDNARDLGLIYGLSDINPVYARPYSKSRSIMKFTDYELPLIYYIKVNAFEKDYPLKIEYDDFNFPDSALFILTESLDSNSKFKLNMRDIHTIRPQRHQYIISDTTIKEFYVIYYWNKSKQLKIFDPKSWKAMFCPGDSFVIPIKTYGLFNDDNQFIVEISDTNGEWNSNTKTVSIIFGKYCDTIFTFTPEDVLEGSHYKLRLRSTSPEYMFSENDVYMNIYPSIPVVSVSDTILFKKNYINITAISPKQSNFYLYDLPEGGNKITELYESQKIFINRDTVFYVEAESWFKDCKTTKRAKVSIRMVTPVEDILVKNSNFIISPNPASEYIEISVGAHCNVPVHNFVIQIYNVYGECLSNLSPTSYTPLTPLERGMEKGVRIDVSNFPNGIYFIRIGNDIEKFVVLR